jgi:DNA repair protein RecN (Recombination protein N)
MQVLDALAGNKEIRSQYGEAFRTYSCLLKKLHELKEAVARDASEQDYLQYQLKQLEEAKLKEGEQEELENEARTLSHVEEIKTGLFNIENTLLNDERGAVLLLKDALNNMQKLSKLFPGADEMIGRLESAYLDIKDLGSEIASHQEKMEFDPDRLKFVSERLDLIYTLLQKHKLDSEADLIQLRNELEEKLLMISNFDEQLEKLREETDLAMEKVRERAALLTHSRKKAAQKLETDLVEKVSVLGMPNMKFACELTVREHPDITGLDDVSFTFSANKNAPLKPVADIASGGEISRLMLGIKALVAGAMALPSIIFDEIDTGVSGEIADKMGNIMHDLGKVMQVITITHLPQIAAKGDTHYFVYKDEVNDVTETHIRMLSQKERIKEIAQMLSGSELTDAALENAKNLLKL